MAEVKDYNPHELTKVECLCGCQNLMPLGLVKKGWTYLRGHRPTQTKPTVSGMRKFVKSNMGPEQISAYFTAIIDGLKKDSIKLKDEAQDLLAEARAKMEAVKKIDLKIEAVAETRRSVDNSLAQIFKEEAKKPEA